MRPSETSRFNALLCALALIGCALAARPFVETGISDDWSYVRTAQLLAQTGHVVYNGWAAMLLGWQLPVAALSFKLFGFSFTAARMSMLVIAAATTFMIQRSFVQAGLAEWNATLATLTLVLSPLFLPLSLMFMTDVSGLFAIGVCFYGCLRALKASSSHKSAAWISFAALFNAVGGTARQIAWLGVLVMVPSAMWLLRRQKNVVIVGMAALTVSIAIIFGSLHWFLLQPHTLSESPWIKLFSLAVCRVLLYQLLRIIVGVSFLMLPVLFGYLLALRRSRRQLPAVLAIVILGMCLARMLQLHSFQGIVPWPIPPIFAGGIVSSAGIWEASPIFGTRPEWLSWHIRLIVTAITLVSLISTILVVCFGVRKHLGNKGQEDIPWRSLLVLSLPFLMAYLLLLAPRAISTGLFDRYLLPILLVILPLAVRYYQEFISTRLPFSTCAFVVFVAIVTVAGTHDLFAMFRATLAAAAEVHASGVSETAIDAGWEYNALTELNAVGFISSPPNLKASDLPKGPNLCPQVFAAVFPHVHPQYSIAFDPNVCGGRADFAPVTYSMWLPWRKVTIFVVKNPIAQPH